MHLLEAEGCKEKKMKIASVRIKLNRRLRGSVLQNLLQPRSAGETSSQGMGG